MKILIALAFFLLQTGMSLAATILYSYQDLGVLGFVPVAMNNRGWIVGNATNQVFRYRPGIGVERITTGGRATDINDAGTIVGYFDGNGHAPNRAFVRPAGKPVTEIGTLGGTDSIASAINDNGQIVGVSTTSNGTQRAFLYTNESGMIDLNTELTGNTSAVAINELGQVLLVNSPPGSALAYSYLLQNPDGNLVEIDPWPGEQFNGEGLSDNSTITGLINRRTVVYSTTTGLRRIGTLGGERSSPAAINDRGWVTGWSYLEENRILTAFLYVYGQGMMDLNSLVPGLDEHLRFAFDINDRDQILAQGRNGHSYLLTRIRVESSLKEINNPEPSTFLSALGAFGVIVVVRLRKPQ